MSLWREGGRQKVISKMTMIVYVRGTESLKKVAQGVKRGQIADKFKGEAITPTDYHCER